MWLWNCRQLSAADRGKCFIILVIKSTIKIRTMGQEGPFELQPHTHPHTGTLGWPIALCWMSDFLPLRSPQMAPICPPRCLSFVPLWPHPSALFSACCTIKSERQKVLPSGLPSSSHLQRQMLTSKQHTPIFCILPYLHLDSHHNYVMICCDLTALNK